MNIDVYTATGAKKGSIELPDCLFAAPIRTGLMHQAVVMQQSNRRASTAHAKTRSEVQGSTAKLFAQKGTGRARRGSIRSPLLRGGGKAFGPRKNMNRVKDMPKAMRRAALLSALSLQAKNNAIIGLESYPEEIKTKAAAELIRKLPVEYGRRILFVMPGKNSPLALSVRNIPGAKAIMADYLNPEDILKSRHLVFLVEAIARAAELFGATDKKGAKGVPPPPLATLVRPSPDAGEGLAKESEPGRGHITSAPFAVPSPTSKKTTKRVTRSKSK